MALPRGLYPPVFAVRETQNRLQVSTHVSQALENSEKSIISVYACFWVFSPAYWTFVGHKRWRAELPTQGLRAERAEAVSPAVASHTTGCSSQACTSATAS